MRSPPRPGSCPTGGSTPAGGCRVTPPRPAAAGGRRRRAGLPFDSGRPGGAARPAGSTSWSASSASAHPRRPRPPVRPVGADPRAPSAPSSSSDRSSTTATSCPGASPSPTSSSIPRGRRRPHRRGAAGRASSCAYADRPLRIGSFSAASNVTGIVSDTHRDLGAAARARRARVSGTSPPPAPYIDIEMNPRCADHPLAYKDAIVLSPHKFIGGPGTPGVLVAAARAADQHGAGRRGRRHGGVRQPERARLPRRPRAPRGGRAPPRSSSRSAPAWCSSSRAPSASTRSARTSGLPRSGRSPHGTQHPNIQILGNRDADRLSIVSFTIRRPSGRYLHHNFVVAMLNDLFGIQSRGGCSCAGPYGHRLLGIDIERSHEFEREITPRLRGHQARLGARQLQLLHQRGRVRVHRRRGRPRGRPRLGAAARLPLRPGDRDVAAPRRPGRAAAAAGRRGLRRRRRACATRGTATRRPSRALAGYLDEARALLRARPRAADATRRRRACPHDFEALRWFDLPAICVQTP